MLKMQTILGYIFILFLWILKVTKREQKTNNVSTYDFSKNIIVAGHGLRGQLVGFPTILHVYDSNGDGAHGHSK